MVSAYAHSYKNYKVARELVMKSQRAKRNTSKVRLHKRYQSAFGEMDRRVGEVWSNVRNHPMQNEVFSRQGERLYSGLNVVSRLTMHILIREVNVWVPFVSNGGSGSNVLIVRIGNMSARAQMDGSFVRSALHLSGITSFLSNRHHAWSNISDAVADISYDSIAASFVRSDGALFDLECNWGRAKTNIDESMKEGSPCCRLMLPGMKTQIHATLPLVAAGATGKHPLKIMFYAICEGPVATADVSVVRSIVGLRETYFTNLGVLLVRGQNKKHMKVHSLLRVMVLLKALKIPKICGEDMHHHQASLPSFLQCLEIYLCP